MKNSFLATSKICVVEKSDNLSSNKFDKCDLW